jgi:hypothetical protein
MFELEVHHHLSNPLQGPDHRYSLLLLLDLIHLVWNLNHHLKVGGELINVITAEMCGRLVVPSQGREALGMGLGEATKRLQVIECAGQERGEERVPGMSTILPSSPSFPSHLAFLISWPYIALTLTLST